MRDGTLGQGEEKALEGHVGASLFDYRRPARSIYNPMSRLFGTATSRALARVVY